jgi:hypothetical protein
MVHNKLGTFFLSLTYRKGDYTTIIYSWIWEQNITYSIMAKTLIQYLNLVTSIGTMQNVLHLQDLSWYDLQLLKYKF